MKDKDGIEGKQFGYLIGIPPTVHWTVGGGSPLIPTSNLSMEFAVSVMSRILRRSILGATIEGELRICYRRIVFK